MISDMMTLIYLCHYLITVYNCNIICSEFVKQCLVLGHNASHHNDTNALKFWRRDHRNIFNVRGGAVQIWLKTYKNVLIIISVKVCHSISRNTTYDIRSALFRFVFIRFYPWYRFNVFMWCINQRLRNSFIGTRVMDRLRRCQWLYLEGVGCDHRVPWHQSLTILTAGLPVRLSIHVCCLSYSCAFSR